MDESSIPDNPIKPENTKPKTKNVTKIITVILVVVILVVGYFYAAAKREISDQKREIALLKTDDQQTATQGNAEVTQKDISESSDSDCNTGSNYTAVVGRFSLSLSNPNIIIRLLDGAFEGGPVSSLEIGRCVSGEVGVVDRYPVHEVNIFAHPASTSTDLKAQYESRVGMSLNPAGSVVVDGVSANKYTNDGLFSATVLYFDRAGIGYQIELVDTNDITNAILTDVLTDWSFTP